ncbi:MAG: hypothetical protein J6W52_02345 [Bacteroidaceae bacterium]|nr:hypothetical protein [Bacteroidaceae bacterium]
MKQKLLLSLFLLLTVTGVWAQDENAAFYIYQNDGHFNGFFYDEVLKMSYSKIDTAGREYDVFMTQEVVTADSTYRIMLSAIDSIGFVQPEVKFNPRLRRVDEQPYGISWNEHDNLFGVYVPNSLGVTEDELPHVGDVFVNFDPEEGWSGKVVSITKVYSDEYETDYHVQCEPITDITDIFHQFVSVEQYGYDEQGNMVRRRVAGKPEMNVGTFVKKRAEGNWEGDLFNFSINGYIPLYDQADKVIAINPSIEGKLHLKTEWNLSLLGDKHISIFTKLYYGIGCGFSIDGKFADLFPAELGKFTSLPIPANAPLFYLDITPDAFLKAEAHVNAKLVSPKLKGAFWSKLDIDNWIPFLDTGFGNSDGEPDEPDEDNPVELKMSINGMIHTGMLFPLKLKSLPVIGKFFSASIGGHWFVGPKIAADFTLDLTNLPWHDVATYNQLKNITLSLHMLDADFEVKGNFKTYFTGEKEVTLADGGVSIIPPIDARIVPEFGETADYTAKRKIGEKERNCRIIAFKPTGFVIKPVDVGVDLFDVKDDGTIDYDEGQEGGYRMYYHFAQLFGQPLEKEKWPEFVLPYVVGRMTQRAGKKRAVPFVVLGGTKFYTPNTYDFETEGMFTATGNTFEVNYDGTVKKEVCLIGYIDYINQWTGIISDGGRVFLDYFSTNFLKMSGPAMAGDKNVFRTIVDMEKFRKNYSPIDTMKYEETLALHKKIDEEETIDAPFSMNIHVLPNQKENPVLKSLKVDTHKLPGVLDITLENPDATITRFSRKENDVLKGGWHVEINNENVKASFDLECIVGIKNAFHVTNGTISFSKSFTSEEEGKVYSVSGNGTLDGIHENYHPYDDYRFEKQFAIEDLTIGTYKERRGNTVIETEDIKCDILLNFSF